MDKALFAWLAIVAMLLLVRMGAVRLIWMVIPVVAKLMEILAMWEQLVTHVGKIINFFRMMEIPSPLKLQPGRDHAELERAQMIRFTREEIRQVTDNFARCIAKGDSGMVYKGKLRNGRQVAVKRLKDSKLRLADATFRRELTLLQPLRHENIIRLLGSCEEEGERMLVYEHMDRGTLRDLLDHEPAPSWRRRVEVLLGAARGIRHLQLHAKQRLIHGNVTSSNILLGRSFTPRLSGFGVSAGGEASQPVDVFQTDGYADPEYHSIGLLQPKTDVYSLGVVMLEVLTGKKPSRTLVSWALPRIKDEKLGGVIDRRPAAEPTSCQRKALRHVARTARRCLCAARDRRPEISEVVLHLKEALKLISTDDDCRGA